MIWRAVFLDKDALPVREVVYAADSLLDAVTLIANGTVTIPRGSDSLELEPHPDAEEPPAAQ